MPPARCTVREFTLQRNPSNLNQEDMSLVKAIEMFWASKINDY